MMSPTDIMNALEVIVEDAHAAVLTTVNADGLPRSRWMTPILVKARPWSIFAFTRPMTRKVGDINAHSQVEWMFQTRALGTVINVVGDIEIIDHPALKAELLEVIGPRLSVFWKVDMAHTEFVVLETRIKEAMHFRPMKAEKQRVIFTD